MGSKQTRTCSCGGVIASTSEALLNKWWENHQKSCPRAGTKKETK